MFNRSMNATGMHTKSKENRALRKVLRDNLTANQIRWIFGSVEQWGNLINMVGCVRLTCIVDQGVRDRFDNHRCDKGQPWFRAWRVRRCIWYTQRGPVDTRGTPRNSQKWTNSPIASGIVEKLTINLNLYCRTDRRCPGCFRGSKIFWMNKFASEAHGLVVLYRKMWNWKSDRCTCQALLGRFCMGALRFRAPSPSSTLCMHVYRKLSV